MVARLLFIATVLAAAVFPATVKVANTMGRGVTVKASCASVHPAGNSGQKTLKNGAPQPDDCALDVWCDVNSSNGKGHTFTAISGCPGPFDFQLGFFLRGDGIYKGSFDGSNLAKWIAW